VCIVLVYIRETDMNDESLGQEWRNVFAGTEGSQRKSVTKS
jgi:hypothetical protein